MLHTTNKRQTLQYYLITLITYLCCCAASNQLLANPTSKDALRTKIDQIIIDLRKELKSSQKEFNQFIFKQDICVKTLPSCLKIKDIAKARKYYFQSEMTNTTEMLEFSAIADLKKLFLLSNILNFSKHKQKQLIQQISLELNRLSSEWFLKFHKEVLKKNNLWLENIAINNSIIIFAKSNTKTATNTYLMTDISNKIAIGILDSGVSIYHQQMRDVDIIQYNPLDKSFALKDTALGHASGILSLLSVKKNDEIKSGFIESGMYFSCNGLPKGKYNYQLIIQCMNWFFLQPKIDVIINAWLASKPGCKNEWQLPIEALLTSNIVPIFSAGNYASNKNGMNYSPANLILNNLDYPLLTVGALNQSHQRLPSSSFGLSACENNKPFKHYQANIFTKGEDLKVAIPLGKDTFQFASGTSYSIAEAAFATAKLIQQFPNKTSEEIVNVILLSAKKQNNRETFGYGYLDFERARQLLKESNRTSSFGP